MGYFIRYNVQVFRLVQYWSIQKIAEDHSGSWIRVSETNLCQFSHISYIWINQTCWAHSQSFKHNRMHLIMCSMSPISSEFEFLNLSVLGSANVSTRHPHNISSAWSVILSWPGSPPIRSCGCPLAFLFSSTWFFHPSPYTTIPSSVAFFVSYLTCIFAFRSITVFLPVFSSSASFLRPLLLIYLLCAPTSLRVYSIDFCRAVSVFNWGRWNAILSRAVGLV